MACNANALPPSLIPAPSLGFQRRIWKSLRFGWICFGENILQPPANFYRTHKFCPNVLIKWITKSSSRCIFVDSKSACAALSGRCHCSVDGTQRRESQSQACEIPARLVSSRLKIIANNCSLKSSVCIVVSSSSVLIPLSSHFCVGHFSNCQILSFKCSNSFLWCS